MLRASTVVLVVAQEEGGQRGHGCTSMLKAVACSLLRTSTCCCVLPLWCCRQDLSVATSQMSELFSRVRDIQRKAADSEVLVQEICRDIRKVCPAAESITL